MRHYKLHSSIHLASSISLLLLLSCTQSIVTTSIDNNVLPLGLSVRSSEVEVEADPTGFDGTNNDYYGVLDTSSWNYNSFDFKYCRTIHYNISASSLFL